MTEKHARFSAAAIMAALLLTSCSTEPEPRAREELDMMVYIAVAAGDTESLVLGELYENALLQRNRAATVQISQEPDPARFTELREQGRDLVVACSGELLEYFNPELATELAAEYRAAGEADLNSGEWRERTYAALLGSLPGTLAATDPSNAVGCADSGDLPQNIVPVYRKAAFDRSGREVLNWVSGALSTEELAELAATEPEHEALTRQVEEYLAGEGF